MILIFLKKDLGRCSFARNISKRIFRVATFYNQLKFVIVVLSSFVKQALSLSLDKHNSYAIYAVMLHIYVTEDIPFLAKIVAGIQSLSLNFEMASYQKYLAGNECNLIFFFFWSCNYFSL
jgi:hypothetical protein